MHIDIHPSKSNCKVITFPVYPHLKKFIYRFYEIPDQREIDLERYIHTSMYVAITATIKSKRKKKTSRDEYSGTERYTDQISFILTASLSKHTLINPILIRFSNEFDKVFKESFYQWVIAQEHAGINNSEAVRTFKSKYGITENDYSTDNFRRLWLRFGEYKKKRQVIPV